MKKMEQLETQILSTNAALVYHLQEMTMMMTLTDDANTLKTKPKVKTQKRASEKKEKQPEQLAVEQNFKKKSLTSEGRSLNHQLLP